MVITNIDDAMWPGILAVQHEMYTEVAPEKLAVLQSKWRQSPQSCFVFRTGDKVDAYVIAHTWNRAQPPKLHKELPSDCAGETLFLHDLAVSNRVAGRGIGSRLVKRIVDVGAILNCAEIRLVSVQESAAFWHRHGFIPLADVEVSECYGEGACVMRRTLHSF
ncbi:GNAT family N-acetyltransferase [Vibrio fluvialis]|nr:GNAT family N-acetyltransferase [Vibrio fluvialis]MBY7800321.1 GNAT family N-acetyltransferase [Vibrio fluvialis]MBY7959887.1 GNAT family N-acetyltransferase [Vibrio fluvialis]MBY7964918.1 GNAT family N-acetyltransferase [Vibrio fluvialis]MBY8076340.1 GNAT family N-acetyltransferase [Vibrio fluvialis]